MNSVTMLRKQVSHSYWAESNTTLLAGASGGSGAVPEVRQDPLRSDAEAVRGRQVQTSFALA